jgi:hypothetical protein
VLVHEWQQQIAMLDALTGLALQETSRACEPAGRLTDVAPAREAESYPERAPCRSRCVTGVEVRAMRAVEGCGEVILATDQQRGHGEPPQILCAERAHAIGRGQGCVRIAPPALRITRAPALQLGRVGRIYHAAAPRNMADWRVDATNPRPRG